MGAITNQTPTLQALILADDVYIDRDTGKKVIAGTFKDLQSSEFPASFARTTKAFISLTGARGDLRLQLRWVDLADDRVWMESPELVHNTKDNDPLMTYEFIIAVPGFPMPHPGHFAFEVYCNDQRLGALRMVVLKRETGA
jgi:hypothetical protein